MFCASWYLNYLIALEGLDLNFGAENGLSKTYVLFCYDVRAFSLEVGVRSYC